MVEVTGGIVMNAVPIIAALLAQAAPSDSAPVVKGAEFFTEDKRTAEPAVQPGTRVPNRPDTSCYHWAVFVEAEQRSVRVREAFKLPAPAKQWGTGPGRTDVIEDRSGAVTEFDDDLSDGLISNGWCVAAGDPSGDHQIRVYVGDRLLHIFDFRVEPELY